MTPAQKYKAKCIAAGMYRKGGKYYRPYDPIRDAPRRRRNHLARLSRAH